MLGVSVLLGFKISRNRALMLEAEAYRERLDTTALRELVNYFDDLIKVVDSTQSIWYDPPRGSRIFA